MNIDRFANTILLLLMGLAVGACQQQSDKAAGLSVEGAYIKVMPPGQNRAAGYFVIVNPTAEDRQVLNVEADVAGQAEVHRHIHEDGMMKMRQVSHVLVPAGGSVTFEPGGYHLMLLDIAQPPAVGSQFSATMEFDGGEKVTFPVDVRPL